MKKLDTPRGLRWTKDRVQSFRARNRIKQSTKTDDSDVMTGQQARDYLGIGYHGLMALVRRDVIHTNQVTDFAPWRIARAELDSEPVRALVKILKATGKLPPHRGLPQHQRRLFPVKSTNLRKGAL